MKSRLGLWMGLALCAAAFSATAKDTDQPKTAQPEKAKEDKTKRRAEIDAYFAGPMKRLTVEIKPEGLELLRAEPRMYVEAQMSEAGVASKHVGLKLKGSEGSFKPVDEKPGMTLNFEKYKGSERFHGQKKMHLNNGNEDPSFLREWLAGEIAAAMGQPAGRCSHAMVSINGKDKGLYVVREGFTKDFLVARFGDDSGALFEGHFCKDIDLELQLDSGDESARNRLKELLAACEVEKPEERWERLGKVLDLEAYAGYLAAEQILDFSDGYDFNLNNYRLYVCRDKVHFVMHGMDEIFKNPEESLQRGSRGRVGQAFMGCPQGQELYRKKVTELYQNVLLKHDWPAILAARADLVKGGLQAAGSRKVKEFAKQAEGLRADVMKRIESVGQQLNDWPEPLTFDAKGVAALPKEWHEENENGDAAELGEEAPEGKPALHVRAKDESSASWRHSVLLDAGKYRFEAMARVHGVEATDDEKGRGAGLRISGSERERKNALAGDAGWTEAAYEFEIDGTREVVLVAELRARKGEAWFARDSLRLVKLK